MHADLANLRKEIAGTLQTAIADLSGRLQQQLQLIQVLSHPPQSKAIQFYYNEPKTEEFTDSWKTTWLVTLTRLEKQDTYDHKCTVIQKSGNRAARFATKNWDHLYAVWPASGVSSIAPCPYGCWTSLDITIQ